MREVAVIGIGQTEIGEHWDKSLRELAGEAVLKAMSDAGLDYFDGLYVGNMMSSSANSQQHLGAYIADWVGQRGKEAYRLESACSSGAAAFRAALLAVASGELDVAVAVGVEKMTDSPSAEITASLATAADADWEVSQGVSFVALNALIMQRYLFEYGWKRSDFANFSINAHANAMHNPNARFHMRITEKQFEDSGVICDPITLMDASPIGDGSAAVLIVPVEKLIPLTNKPVIRVAGSGAASDTIAAHARKNPLWLTAAEKSSKDAFSQAGIDQSSIDFFEYHDAFTIMAALSLEACGFAERGQGPRLALDNEIRKGGKIPVATLGGLKARGHPVGATGMYQIAELVIQLRGQAGEAQIDGARWGMAQNIGGSGSNIITHILTNAS
jgi:acetyl-CoA C-acetyltransferase